MGTPQGHWSAALVLVTGTVLGILVPGCDRIACINFDEDRRLGDFPGYQATLEAWQREIIEDPVLLEICTSPDGFWSQVAGECAGGRVVFLDSGGDGIETLFFDADSGEFIAYSRLSDADDPLCHGTTFWPRLVNCDDPLVTQILCGRSYVIGDPIFLP